MSAPKVCIGIPFTNWNLQVEETLTHCLKLKYPNFVVVLVPNEGADIPGVFCADPRVRVRPTQSHRIAVKRNVGLLSEEADFFGCLDSDSYPLEDWLEKGIEAFATSGRIMAVGGPNLSPEYADKRRRAVAASLRSFLTGGPRVFNKRAASEDRYAGDLPTCNLILSKRAVEATGGFDPTINTAEDTDICHRIRRAGGAVYYSRNVVVYHHNRSLWIPYCKQKITMGYAVFPFLKRNFSVGKIFFLSPFVFLIYLLAGWVPVIYSPLFLWIWCAVIFVYLLTVLTEAWRWAEQPGDMAYTVGALIIGNLGPAVGTALHVMGIPIDFKTFYVNYEQPDETSQRNPNLLEGSVRTASGAGLPDTPPDRFKG